MAVKQEDYKSIMADMKAGRYKPVYLLMGEESYFIDSICEYIKQNALTDDEKEFDLLQLYGSETTVADMLATARRFPMFARRSVVIVKEAQALSDFDDIASYVSRPQMQTVLVLCYKYKKIDGRKKYLSDISNIGVVFESKKLSDRMVTPFVSEYMSELGWKIDQKALQMLIDFLGTDLTRIINELNKLCQIIKDGKLIMPEHIEKYVGISKDFNPFELLKAIIAKNAFQCNRIVFYYGKNTKTNPIQPVLSILFNFFSNLMIYLYMKDKSDSMLVARELGVAPYFVRDYETAAKNYNAFKTMRIISVIRESDARSKGVNQTAVPDGELLKELVHFIIY